MVVVKFVLNTKRLKVCQLTFFYSFVIITLAIENIKFILAYFALILLIRFAQQS